MILAFCVLSVGVVLAVVAPRRLNRRHASTRAPLADLAAWHLTSWIAVASVVLGLTALASPSWLSSIRLPAALESCVAALRHIPDPLGSTTIRLAAGAAIAAIVVRLGWVAVTIAVHNYRSRCRHRSLLGLLARRDRQLGAHVIDDSTAIVYCLPGDGGRIVFTSAALAQLGPAHRAAVLAHEQAHLRGRHHLLIAIAHLLTRAFPGITLFRECHTHTTRLVEMHADDVAARRWGAQVVAEALLALSATSLDSTALGASAVATVERVARLLGDPQPRTRARNAGVRMATTAVLAVAITGWPVLLAGAGHAAFCLF